jgi:hypothetical protein
MTSFIYTHKYWSTNTFNNEFFQWYLIFHLKTTRYILPDLDEYLYTYTNRYKYWSICTNRTLTCTYLRSLGISILRRAPVFLIVIAGGRIWGVNPDPDTDPALTLTWTFQDPDTDPALTRNGTNIDPALAWTGTFQEVMDIRMNNYIHMYIYAYMY